jgi:hypothetical protein
MEFLTSFITDIINNPYHFSGALIALWFIIVWGVAFITYLIEKNSSTRLEASVIGGYRNATIIHIVFTFLLGIVFYYINFDLDVLVIIVASLLFVADVIFIISLTQKIQYINQRG